MRVMWLVLALAACGGDDPKDSGPVDVVDVPDTDMSDAHGGTDCDDTDPLAYGGASEAWYDGVDQACDGGDDYDQDADGMRATGFGGDDCADTDPAIFAGAPDAWYDGVDSDCLGNDDYDQDADTYVSDAYGGADCADLDPKINPGAKEKLLDGIDQDCNPMVGD